PKNSSPTPSPPSPPSAKKPRRSSPSPNTSSNANTSGMSPVVKQSPLLFSSPKGICVSHRPAPQRITSHPNHYNAAMEIKRIGTEPSAKGPSDWFTGAVRIDPLFQ